MRSVSPDPHSNGCQIKFDRSKLLTFQRLDHASSRVNGANEVIVRKIESFGETNIEQNQRCLATIDLLKIALERALSAQSAGDCALSILNLPFDDSEKIKWMVACCEIADRNSIFTNDAISNAIQAINELKLSISENDSIFGAFSIILEYAAAASRAAHYGAMLIKNQTM